MHPEAWDYIERKLRPYLYVKGLRVVEFGSRDVNGSARNLLPYAIYHGVDIEDGPGVDEVCDAAEWRTEKVFDLVISTETFEHTPVWPTICIRAYEALRPDGKFIITAASDPRAPHSAIDGHHLEEHEDDYYQNIDPGVLTSVLNLCDFRKVEVEVHPRGDVYAIAKK